MRQIFLFLFMLFFSSIMHAQKIPNFGDGHDGDHTVASTDPDYYTDAVRAHVGTISTVGGTSTIPFSGSTGSFAVGDYVMIIDMCPSSCARNYYIRVINKMNSSDFEVNALTTTLSGSCLQAIKILRFRNLNIQGTVTCDPWDGSSGGVICFMVEQTLDISGSGIINANAKIMAPNGGAGGSAGTVSGSHGTVGSGRNATSSTYPRSYGFPGFCFKVQGSATCDYEGCGDEGGSGTIAPMGGIGGSAGNPTAICSTASKSNNVLVGGMPGSSGAGGRGPGAGGNGGAGGGTSGGGATDGTNGTNASGTGGTGGIGGYGGGIIYVIAADITDNTGGSDWATANGGDGGNGGNGGTGGNGGNGGTGGNKQICIGTHWADASGYGGEGRGGNGGAGGNGGNGGGPGTIWFTSSTLGNFPSPLNTSQAGGNKGTKGTGGAAGTNGTHGTNGTTITDISETNTCCPTGGTGGGGGNPIPTTSTELTPQTMVYECECWTIFNQLSNLYVSKAANTPSSGITTFTLTAPTGETKKVEMNANTGLIKLIHTGMQTNGSYSGTYTETFNCQSATAFLTRLQNFIGDFDTQQPVANSYTFPRSMDFTSTNNSWKYIEKNPDNRYLERNNDPNTRVDMVGCDYFETGNLVPYDGWDGEDGVDNTDNGSPEHDAVEPTDVDEDDLRPIVVRPKSTASEKNAGTDVMQRKENTGDVAAAPQFTLQPNPASNVLYLQYSNLPAGHYTIRSTDVLGRTVYEKDLEITENAGRYKINVSTWKPGSYVLRLSNTQLNFEQRAIISR